MTYAPETPEKFGQMRRFFASCHTRDELDAMMLLFFVDRTYPRPDLLEAMKLTCEEKGWPLER